MLGILDFLKLGKKEARFDPKKDRRGRTIANRQGCDTVPNEPFDCIVPPVRIEDERQAREIKQIYQSQKSTQDLN